MLIELKKFGTLLMSRQSGKESFLALNPRLKEISAGEEIEVDFAGVDVFSPSWGDEFLTPLFQLFKDRMTLKNADNPSVRASLEILRDLPDGISFRSSGETRK